MEKASCQLHFLNSFCVYRHDVWNMIHYIDASYVALLLDLPTSAQQANELPRDGSAALKYIVLQAVLSLLCI